MRILFIVKMGHTYGSFDRKFSGLFNSTKFVSDALGSHKEIVSSVVQVIDNNDIDKEVTKFRPDICIIEALWVVPEKFEVLQKLHPKVRWFTRLHSDIAFLAQEGISMLWIPQYLARGVGVITNSLETQRAFKYLGWDSVFLPNYYPASFGSRKDRSMILDVGCFGAVRPLKNQLIQAIAAIRYAELNDQFLRFHVNHTRIEGGESVIKNLRSLFKESPHRLIEHEWHSHDEFKKLLKKMDVVMQVSFSETFNIVAADSVSVGTPCIPSKEIEWMHPLSHVETNHIESIINGISKAMRYTLLLRLNQIRLWNFSRKAKKAWLNWALK
jgi:hypothetical protein